MAVNLNSVCLFFKIAFGAFRKHPVSEDWSSWARNQPLWETTRASQIHVLLTLHDACTAIKR
jgi:hypothetical protein